MIPRPVAVGSFAGYCQVDLGEYRGEPGRRQCIRQCFTASWSANHGRRKCRLPGMWESSLLKDTMQSSRPYRIILWDLILQAYSTGRYFPATLPAILAANMYLSISCLLDYQPRGLNL
jgi:hypothetical protein